MRNTCRYQMAKGVYFFKVFTHFSMPVGNNIVGQLTFFGSVKHGIVYLIKKLPCADGRTVTPSCYHKPQLVLIHCTCLLQGEKFVGCLGRTALLNVVAANFPATIQQTTVR